MVCGDIHAKNVAFPSLHLDPRDCSHVMLCERDIPAHRLRVGSTKVDARTDLLDYQGAFPRHCYDHLSVRFLSEQSPLRVCVDENSSETSNGVALLTGVSLSVPGRGLAHLKTPVGVMQISRNSLLVVVGVRWVSIYAHLNLIPLTARVKRYATREA